MAFWSKDSTVRINETIDYISALCPGGERPTVKSFLLKWIQTNIGGGDGLKLFSDQLSTTLRWGAGDEKTRSAKRALALLSGNAMLNMANPRYNGVDAVMAMSPVTVAQKLGALIDPLRIFASQQENAGNLLQTELDKLRNHTETFLGLNLVVCQSWGAPPGGDRDHKFLFNYKEQSYSMVPQGMGVPGFLNGSGITIKAVNVPEMYWARVPGRGTVPSGPTAGTFARIVSTPLTGADLMVTSAFTGCSFVFKTNVGGSYAAHISPATTIDPPIGPAPQLANQLINNGNFEEPAGARAGNVQVWGRGASNIVGHLAGYTVDPIPGAPLINSSMYVIGSRASGSWRFFSQENRSGAKKVTRLL